MRIMNILSSDLRHYAKLFVTLKYKNNDKCMYIIVANGVKMESNSLIYNNVTRIFG